MTSAMEFGVPWMAAGAVVMFLSFCVWHNRRTGYQRIRGEKISPGEAIIRIRQSLALSYHALPVADLGSVSPFVQTEQLLRLSSILGYGRKKEAAELSETETLAARK